MLMLSLLYVRPMWRGIGGLLTITKAQPNTGPRINPPR